MEPFEEVSGSMVCAFSAEIEHCRPTTEGTRAAAGIGTVWLWVNPFLEEQNGPVG